MTKISCNIIKDILPLYLEDVVSDDTREMVEEHLQSCQSCRNEVTALKQNIVLPANKSVQLSEGRVLKGIRKHFFRRKVVVSTISVLAAVVLMIGIYFALVSFKTLIPYDSTQISITEADGKVYASYQGNDLAGEVSIDPMTITIDGTEKEIVIFYFYKTPLSGILSHFDKSSTQSGHMTFVGESSDVDEVYYGKFARNDVFNGGAGLEDVIKQAESVWGK
jgi:hypothetical protein